MHEAVEKADRERKDLVMMRKPTARDMAARDEAERTKGGKERR